MNNNNGALDFDAYINDTDFKKSIDEMKARIIGLSKTAEDEGNKIDSVFKKIGAGVATYFSAQALANFGKQIINVRGEFQQLEVAFTTMLGSKDKADQLMEQLVRTAATTPFDLKSVSGGAKQLLAYGESAETVNKTLVRLGNIASGLSLPLNDLVYLYGTTMVQGRLFTQDVRQFMGRGIPLVQELSKELGVTTEEVNAMVTAGKIGFPEVQRVIERLTDEGGMFYNLMEEQSKTLAGQISNLEDAWTSMLNEIGKDTQDMASDAIQFLAGLIEHYDTILKILKTLIITYGAYKAAVITLNAVQAVQIQLAQGYTIAELAKYRALLLAEKAQKLLNKTMLANPYVLAATAVVGLVTALVTFGGAATEAEKAQQRLNDAEKRASETVDDEIAKIQSLVTIITSETAAQREKEKALRDLHKLSPDHFADIDEEAFRTGLAKAAIDDYIESLRQKVLLQEYEHELAESFKRQEAAERGENEVGFFKKMFLGVATSEQNQYGVGPTVDYVAEANKELNAGIVEAEKKLQEQIKGKIEALVNGSGKAAETPATTGIKTVADRIKEIDDEISKLESSRGKLAATDAAGIAKINGEISKLNDEKKKLEGKGSSGSKDRYAGAEKESLNYYKKLKEESVKALENLSTADAKYAEKQAALLGKIAEAERMILEIEGGNGTLSQKLEYRRKQYETYEKWVAAGLKKEADQEFATLLKNGNSYVEYLDKQIAEIKAKGDNLTAEDSKNLVTLFEARDGATGKKSPLEVFKENLEQAKLESKNLVEYLEKVKKLEEELADDNSELGVAKKGYLAEEDTATTKSISEETKAALREYESYTQKRARIDAEYRYKKALIDKVNTDGQYNDNLAALQKWYNEALSSLDSEVTSKSDLWIRLFANASQLSKASIKSVIADTKALLNYLNGATKVKPAGFTDEQLDTLGKDPEKIKAIYDALIKQQDELDSRSNYTMSGFVKGFGDLKEAAELQKKAQKETNEELKKTLLLQAEMARQKGMDEILGGIQDFGDVVSTFGSKIQELADATGDQGLKDTAEALSGLGNIISTTAAGAAAGGWVGAIIGAVTSIGSVLFDSFTQAEKSQRQAERDAIAWAHRYQLLLLDLKSEDYESAFGTRAIEKAAKAYELLCQALETYHAYADASVFNDLYNEIASDPANIQEVGVMFWSVANAMSKINKYSTDLENMRVLTKDYGWFAELFGASDEYTALRDLAPQIWANGAFDPEAARAFLETNNQLSAEQREQIQNVIDLYDQYKKLDDELNAIVKETWGELGTTMIDSITQAIATGENAMEIFADKLGDKFADLGEQIAYELFFADAFDDLLTKIKATYGLGSTEAIGRAQADLIGGFFASMHDEAAAAQSWLEQWKEYAAKYGFDIWSGDENDNEDPLTGAVQKITSEEASALAGQLTMVRIKQDQMTAYLGDQLVHLIGIRENTAKTVDRLDQILSKIEGNNVINSLRSKGL